ncbi:Calmodulin-regulated spectrin-associated protein [Heracleum sosnowskyi]|uniref:Calmodulin-regulated spectrin-associated protein n=1 Tax=Heracleum sosnowskyi TaxID=360622 RepID=A0AAD8MYZ3_9APIA|nr:Calmodulin-regulated spectrin-associated protein [Heracleum sosnowskyi]
MDSLSYNKRVRDNSDTSESTQSETRRRVHDDPEITESVQNDANKRPRHNSEIAELTQTESKRLGEDFLDDLDDSDICTTSPDLDLFMKSFEQEISGSIPPTVKIIDLETDSGESRPDLGYLLEASDDELGIPPTEKPIDTELFRVTTESTELWRFDEQTSFGYDSFDLGFNDEIYEHNSNSTEFVALDSLFDYTDWQSETLPAL